MNPLPAVGACVTIRSGAIYTVEEQVPETRDYGDSARGFVWALRINERGTIQSAKRRRLNPADIVGIWPNK